MDRIKAAVLFDCDERQREELEAAGKDMVEFVYVPGGYEQRRAAANVKAGADYLWTAGTSRDRSV